MNLSEYLQQAEDTVEESLLSYLDMMREEDEDCGYTVRDVNACMALINGYLNSLSRLKAPSEAKILDLVRDLVLALNDLNEQTEEPMLETDAREAICELIQSSAIACGLADTGEDITEAWREW